MEPTLYVDKNAEGATRITALVSEDGESFYHTVCYYLLEEEDNPREDFVSEIMGKGWRFEEMEGE